jgi:hypothetical protein
MRSAMLVVLAAGLLAGLVLLTVWFTRARRGTRDAASTLKVARVVAVVYGVLVLLGTLITVLQTLLEDAVQLSLPVRTFWPDLRPTVEILDGPTATVAGGGFEQAEVAVAGLDLTARLLLAGGHALQGITMALIAGAIALLCTRLLAGSPFRPVVSRVMMIAASAVAAGGIAWQICFELAGLLASSQVLTVNAWTASEAVTAEGVTGLPEPAMGFEIEFWPLFLALALAALAAAFRHGERLQRDVEGLV